MGLRVFFRKHLSHFMWKALVLEVMEYLAAEFTALNMTLKMVQLFAVKFVDWIRM